MIKFMTIWAKNMASKMIITYFLTKDIQQMTDNDRQPSILKAHMSTMCSAEPKNNISDYIYTLYKYHMALSWTVHIVNLRRILSPE